MSGGTSTKRRGFRDSVAEQVPHPLRLSRGAGEAPGIRDGSRGGRGEVSGKSMFWGDRETWQCHVSTSNGFKFAAFLVAFVILACSERPAIAQTAVTTPLPPTQLTAEQDHQRMMDLLHIAALRPGADGNHPEAANAANYDEAKANPFPDLPDALLLKNGKKVTTAKAWWQKRRPEIAEEFDREIYGRVPAITPKV